MALPAAAPPVPDVVAATQQPVEMQTLAQHQEVQDEEVKQLRFMGRGGEAREIHYMGHAPDMTGTLPVADPQAAQVTSERGDHEARTRVLAISLVLAGYVVFGALMHYALDIAAFEEVIRTFHHVLHLHGGTPNVALMVINGIPKLTMSIGVSLLVPLCGYMGVKQNQQGLLGCFCFCNLLSSCCGLIGIVILVTLMVGSVNMAPGLEAWMKLCDPMRCAPAGLNMTQKSHVVDCLASQYWEEYEPRFKNHNRWYPPNCPKVFLTCKGWESPQGHDVEPWNKGHDVGPWNKDSRVPMFRRGHGGWGPNPEVTDRRLAWGHELKGGQELHQKVLGYGAPHQEVPPMPSDPISDCWPDEGLEKFHQARRLVPELTPKFVVFLFVRSVLTVPVVVLGLLGFCWGKDMWTRLGQGYSQVTVQPALGHSAAPPSNQAAQPVVTGVRVQPM